MPSEKQRARQQEVYGAELLMDLIEGRPPNPDHLKWLKQDWKPDLRWAESGGSWNHWQILLSARLWLGDDGILDTIFQSDVINLILEYLRAQLGEQYVPAHPTMSCFGGTEQFSDTYEGMRWGCVSSWRLLALRFPEHPDAKEILRLTARYNEVQTALLALGASPRPTRTGWVVVPSPPGAESRSQGVMVHTNSRGQLWWEGPSLPVSGNRSTPAHVGQDDRAPLYSFYARGNAFRGARFGWPNVVLGHILSAERPSWGNRVQGSIIVSNGDLEPLSDIRLLVPHHFAHWREEGIRANWIERQSNGNTTSIVGHVMYEQEQRATYLFPWPGRIRGRKDREGPGPASCHHIQTGSLRRLVAESRFGEVSCEMPERDPDSHVVMGPEGLEVLR